MSKPTIISIEIELKNYEPIKFTMDEARELYDQLHGLFGEDEQHNHYHTYPYWQRPHLTWYNTANGTNIRGMAGSADATGNNLVISGATAVDALVGKSVQSSNTGMSVSYLSQ